MSDKNVLVLDDGTKEFEMQNLNGDVICLIHIRPGEIGLIDRYNELMQDVERIFAPLQNVTLNSSGDARFQEDWKIVKQVEAEMIERINALFDFHEAADIFKTRSMFSSVGGTFFVERVLEALGGVIRDGMKEEVKLAQTRVEKYTKDLRKRQVNSRVGTAPENN